MCLCALRRDGLGRTHLCPGTTGEGAELTAWLQGQCSWAPAGVERASPAQETCHQSNTYSCAPDGPRRVQRHAGLCWWREGAPGARKVPRKQNAYVAGCPPLLSLYSLGSAARNPRPRPAPESAWASPLPTPHHLFPAKNADVTVHSFPPAVCSHSPSPLSR